MNKIKPSKRQLEFLSWEMGIFFHFGIRSFFLGHSDWDNREMPVSEFNPVKLDCEQWISTAKDAGMKYAVLVAKHHDGFANWPSKFTDYSVANAPWKDGKGDVVAEYVAACRKYGLKVGLYYSPAQWGGKIDFKEETEYDDYFINQVSELLTNYGEIDYLWFDGCGSEGHQYDQDRIVKVMNELQPNMLIFNMWAPSTRWIGNEDGYAPSPNFNTVSSVDFSIMTEEKDSLAKAEFLPAECDFMMRYSTWFDCELNEDTIKEVEELIGIYEYSVGRSANFLINIGPNRDGLLPEPDAKRLLEFGEALKKRYGTPIESFSEVNSDQIVSKEAKLVNRIIIAEDLTDGESIKEFKIYANLPRNSGDRILVYSGTTVGNKAICIIPTVKTGKITVKVTNSNGDYKIKDIKAYYAE